MTLYELTDVYSALLAAIDSGEVPDEAIADTLDGIQASIADKIDNIACLIKSLESDAAAIKAEAKALTNRAEVKQRAADRMRQYLSDMLPRSGYAEKAFESPRNRISWRKSEAVVIEDDIGFVAWAKANMPELLKWEEPQPIKDAIRDGLNAFMEIPLVHIESKKNLQIK